MLNHACPRKEGPLAERNGYRVVSAIRNSKIFKLNVLISVKHSRLIAEFKWPSVTVQDISIHICSFFFSIQYRQKRTQKTLHPHNFRLIFTKSVIVMHSGIATDERSCVIQEDRRSVYFDLMLQRNSIRNSIYICSNLRGRNFHCCRMNVSSVQSSFRKICLMGSKNQENSIRQFFLGGGD